MKHEVDRYVWHVNIVKPVLFVKDSNVIFSICNCESTLTLHTYQTRMATSTFRPQRYRAN